MADRINHLTENVGVCEPDRLFAGVEVTPLIGGAKLSKGHGVVLRGTVLARDEATGLCAPVDSTKAGGLEKPYAVAADTVNTKDDYEYPTEVYLTGVFNPDALTFGGTDTLATHETGMRAVGLLVKH